MKRISGLLVAMVMVFGLAASAHATLILKGQGTSIRGTYNLIYDDDLDVTWYDYTNPVETWQGQVFWANTLEVTFNGTTYYDWRLPVVTDTGNDVCNFDCSGTDCGYNVDTSTGEMAHLFYDELGNLAHYDATGDYQAGWDVTNKGPFDTDLQLYYYWSGTEYAHCILASRGTSSSATAARVRTILASAAKPWPSALGMSPLFLNQARYFF